MDSPSFDRTGLETLVSDAQGGDAAALDDLVRRMHPEMYRWALLKCGDHADAQDAAQDAAWRMYREMGSYAGRSRFTTWAYRLASNAVVDFYRRQRRHRAGREPVEALDHVSHPGRDADVTVANTQFADIVRSFFAELPAGQRTVFYLVDLQGYAPRDVADMLNMNPNTVRAHLLKARRTIRAHLLEKHPEVVEEFNG